MKRKDYERPTLKVVTLQQHQQVLAGSPTGTLPGSEIPEEQNWP